MNQQSLLPVSFVEKRNEQAKLDAYKHSVLRLKLSERLSLQARFLSAEPGRH